MVSSHLQHMCAYICTIHFIVISVIYSHYLARNYPHYAFPVPSISLMFQSSATGSELPIPTSFLTGVSSLTLRSDGAQSHVCAVFLRKAFVLLILFTQRGYGTRSYTGRSDSRLLYQSFRHGYWHYTALSDASGPFLPRCQCRVTTKATTLVHCYMKIIVT
ncbi:hypothetical protein BGY98DRAFT_327288 [Russula aff. rugulosa BPL654]|nr:hypothetical protein BGY98DRAFT_327288 [Russula aff. rugulosa BPL654]